jgi:diamine N-acetyltransferase
MIGGETHVSETLLPETEFLSGERVYLRPVAPQDVARLYQWANDAQTRALTGDTRPSTYAGALAYYERIQQDPERVWLAIVRHDTQQVIGETGLLRMFPAWRTTDWSLIVGDPTARGQGYGSEAAWLMLNYAFGQLNFHRVAIGVVGFNQGALRFYQRLGFQQEGIQRDGYFYEHRYYDFVMMSLLEDEFRGRWAERLVAGAAGPDSAS